MLPTPECIVAQEGAGGKGSEWMDTMDYEESLGSYIRRKIAERGLNQRQAALRIGVTSGMMSNWCNDKRRPEASNIPRLAALLAVDEDDLAIRAGYKQRRDTDLHPKRAELLEVARQLPIEEADIAIGFMKWRIEERYRPRSVRPPDDAGTDTSGGQAAGS